MSSEGSTARADAGRTSGEPLRREAEVDQAEANSDASTIVRELDFSAIEESKRAQRAAAARDRLLRSAAPAEEAFGRSIPLAPSWSVRVRPFDSMIPVQASQLRDLMADVRPFSGAPQVASLHPVLSNVVESSAEKLLVGQLAAVQQFARNMLFVLNDLRDRADRFVDYDPNVGFLADSAMILLTGFVADRVGESRAHFYTKCHSHSPMGIQAYLSALEGLEKRQGPPTVGSSLHGFTSLDDLRQAGFVGQPRSQRWGRKGGRGGSQAAVRTRSPPPSSHQQAGSTAPGHASPGASRGGRGRFYGGGRGGKATATPTRD